MSSLHFSPLSSYSSHLSVSVRLTHTTHTHTHTHTYTYTHTHTKRSPPVIHTPSAHTHTHTHTYTHTHTSLNGFLRRGAVQSINISQLWHCSLSAAFNRLELSYPLCFLDQGHGACKITHTHTHTHTHQQNKSLWNACKQTYMLSITSQSQNHPHSIA